MFCLLFKEFYSEINKKELYLRYLYKLFDLHCNCDNYTEAGYTLQLHADQLSWEHNIIPMPLRCSKYSNLHYHDNLKETLYNDIIHNFEKGQVSDFFFVCEPEEFEDFSLTKLKQKCDDGFRQMWEAALKICKELVQRYEEVTMEYDKLARLLSKMAKFYENIMDLQIIRPAPEYFRVAYYGRGFPAFLQNKVTSCPPPSPPPALTRFRARG